MYKLFILCLVGFLSCFVFTLFGILRALWPHDLGFFINFGKFTAITTSNISSASFSLYTLFGIPGTGTLDLPNPSHSSWILCPFNFSCFCDSVYIISIYLPSTRLIFFKGVQLSRSRGPESDSYVSVSSLGEGKLACWLWAS